jgi:ABC-2 type transport system permease protein
MQSRGFFFVLAFGWMIPPLIYLFVWSTAAGAGTVGGFTRGAFIAYYLVLINVNQLTYSQTNWTVGDLIRYGGMNAQLLYPMPPIYHAIASEIAGKVVFMAFILPVTFILGLILRPEFTITLVQIPLFLLALLLAWALRFFWGYWLALLAFWVTRSDSLLVVQDSLIFLLSGQVAPTALLPGVLRAAALVLPFRYMVGFPVEILTGGLTPGETALGFAIQAAWVVVAVVLYRLIWRAGLRRYAAVGG